MADTKISALTALAGASLATGDLVPVVDVSASATKCMTMAEFMLGLRGTPTTADANADNTFAASAAGKKALVVQSKASLTASPFHVQYSDGTTLFEVQRDGNAVINQQFGNVASKPLSLKYANAEVANIGYLGDGVFNGGLSVNGFFTASAAGDTLARDATARHHLGTGTSPTVTGNGSSNGSIAGKDAFCKVTVGTGVTTSIVITFGTAYATAPVCVVNAQSTTTPINVVTTTTTATLTCAAFTAGEVLCVVTGGF